MKAAVDIPTANARTHQPVMAQHCYTPEFEKSMSHELRTPLNVIIGICQFLLRDERTPLSGMHRDAVDRMERNAHTLLHSVNELLACMREGQMH